MNLIPFHIKRKDALIVYWLLSLFLFIRCDDKDTEIPVINDVKEPQKENIVVQEEAPKEECLLQNQLDSMGLLNVQRVYEQIRVDLKYTTEDNFMQIDMYGCLDSLYLQPDVAEKLYKAQQLLSQIDSNLVLLVYDGTRPLSVQQMMWDSLDLPLHEKIKFVSNPKNGSLHNFGAAVDLTIYDITRDTVLDMGAPYDHVGIEAWPTQELILLNKGVLSAEQVDNRKLLRKVMRHGGFFNIQTEWWHFNSCRRPQAKLKYDIVP